MNKRIILTIVAVVVLIAAGFLWYRGWKIKQKQGNESATRSSQSSFSGAAGDETAETSGEETGFNEDDWDFNAQCENGEWVKIADVQGDAKSAAGRLRKVYPGDENSAGFENYRYFIEGAQKTAVSGEDIAKLDYFEDRDVEIEGANAADGKSVAVSQIRCAGKETDKNLIGNRTKMMQWLAANVNSVAPKKAPYRTWSADIVDFVDEKNVYVEYYDAIEDDNNSDVAADTSRKILVEMSAKSDGSYSARVLAYWEMGEDDYVLKSGTDKFENIEDVDSYQYDAQEKSWTRI